MHDPGASSFLYPFLSEGESDLETVVADVHRSILLKAEEISALREQTLTDNRGTLLDAAATLRARLDGVGKLLAFGNGGSATDAMDAVADFRAAPQGWPPRRAIDLTEDASILTAISNDIGVEEIFQRQVIAYGKAPDAVLALSTSGNSANIIEALAEARRRELMTIASSDTTGDESRRRGSRTMWRSRARNTSPASRKHRRAAITCCASSSSSPRSVRVSSRARRPPASRRRVRARVKGTVQGVGFRPYVFRLATELELGGYVLNDERGVLLEAEGTPKRIEEFLMRLPKDGPPLAAVEGPATEDAPATASANSGIVESERAGQAEALVSPDTTTCADCLAELLDPETAGTGPVHQLHQLRAPLHDRPRCPLRPPPDDHGRLRHVLGRVAPSTTPGTAASMPSRTLPRMRTADPATDSGGAEITIPASRDSIELAAAPARERSILAVKGLGGFHLACRADDAAAVAKLRSRKHREDKPFALMAPSLEAARELVGTDTSRGNELMLGRSGRSLIARRRARRYRGRGRAALT